MWKTFLNKTIIDLRFVLKPSIEQHGAWRFVETKVPELRMLNQNTFFSVAEISNEFETESAIHVNYHDQDLRRETIHTSGLSCEEIEKELIFRVKRGLLEMKRHPEPKMDRWRSIPIDIVNAAEYDPVDHDSCG